MHARAYESIFIAMPTLANDAVESLVKLFEDLIQEKGGNVTATNVWGKRTLAYEIRKFKEGIYVHYEFEGDGEVVKELERRYRLNDSVIKFLTVRLDSANKLKEKGKAQRTAKAQARDRRKKNNQSQEGGR